MAQDTFKTLKEFTPSPGKPAKYHSLAALEAAGLGKISRLPRSIRVVLEALVALGTILFLLLLSAVANAPLKEIANPDVTENPAKAAWYFVSLQELLLHMSPLLAGILVPGALILILLAVPYFDRSTKDRGI